MERDETFVISSVLSLKDASDLADEFLVRVGLGSAVLFGVLVGLIFDDLGRLDRSGVDGFVRVRRGFGFVHVDEKLGRHELGKARLSVGRLATMKELLVSPLKGTKRRVEGRAQSRVRTRSSYLPSSTTVPSSIRTTRSA